MFSLYNTPTHRQYVSFPLILPFKLFILYQRYVLGKLCYHNKNKLKTETNKKKSLLNSLALNFKPFKI